MWRERGEETASGRLAQSDRPDGDGISRWRRRARGGKQRDFCLSLSLAGGKKSPNFLPFLLPLQTKIRKDKIRPCEGRREGAISEKAKK